MVGRLIIPHLNPMDKHTNTKWVLPSLKLWLEERHTCTFDKGVKLLGRLNRRNITSSLNLENTVTFKKSLRRQGFLHSK